MTPKAILQGSFSTEPFPRLPAVAFAAHSDKGGKGFGSLLVTVIKCKETIGCKSLGSQRSLREQRFTVEEARLLCRSMVQAKGLSRHSHG
jgi:hypothetical protein